MKMVLFIAGCLLFLSSVAGYMVVRLRLRPSDDSDLDDYYYEFEEQHPEYARYLKWSRITYVGAIIAALLMVLAFRF